MKLCHALDALGLPGGGKADGLRVDDRVEGGQTVERLLVEDGRDAEAGVLDEEALDVIAHARRGLGGQEGRAGDTRDLADALSQRGARLGRVEGLAVGDLGRPGGAQLGHLLVTVHAAEQVGRALGRAAAGVAVGRVGRWDRCGRKRVDGHERSAFHGADGRGRRSAVDGAVIEGAGSHPLMAPLVRPPMSWRSAKT